jgi:hypothetical protein
VARRERSSSRFDHWWISTRLTCFALERSRCQPPTDPADSSSAREARKRRRTSSSVASGIELDPTCFLGPSPSRPADKAPRRPTHQDHEPDAPAAIGPSSSVQRPGCRRTRRLRRDATIVSSSSADSDGTVTAVNSDQRHLASRRMADRRRASDLSRRKARPRSELVRDFASLSWTATATRLS